ncbi:MAG: class I SAM-dependent methyltransferase, partial [Burkholderiaceae bacterium]
ISDSCTYASMLEKKFDYRNTFLHTDPVLDLSLPIPEALRGTLDFVVCSDVMEHVQPPVLSAFSNLRSLLKTGGILVLTVPFGLEGATVEHFPRLHSFEIVRDGEEATLFNRTVEGDQEVFRDLVFHGGDGSTLEMRIFALPELLAQLQAAGFRDIRVHNETIARFGIVNLDPCSTPITAIAS